MSRVRYGVIDIGSNCVRVEVAERVDHTIRTIRRNRIMTRLGEGLKENNLLDTQAMANSVQAIAQHIAVAKSEGVEDHNFRIVATAAVRQAVNSDAFIGDVLSQCNQQVDVINPNQEAQYAFKSAAHVFNLSNTTVCVLDVGGGSTECVIAIDGEIAHIASAEIGAVTLTSTFNMHDAIDDDQLIQMRKHIQHHLDAQLPHPIPVEKIIAIGGACTALAAMVLHEEECDIADGSVLQLDDIVCAIDTLVVLDAIGRAQLEGVSDHRTEIIVAGAEIVRAMLVHLDCNEMTVHTGGISRGVLLEMAAEANDN